MKIATPEFWETVGMYIRKFQDSSEELLLENIREAEEDFAILLEDVFPCCALCAQIEAWRAIALGLRELAQDGGELKVEVNRHRLAIGFIRKEILPPLCAEQKQLFEAESTAFEAAFAH